MKKLKSDFEKSVSLHLLICVFLSEKPTHEYINPEVTITISVENQQSSLPSVMEGETPNTPGANLLSTVSPSGTVHRSLWSQVPEARSFYTLSIVSLLHYSISPKV